MTDQPDLEIWRKLTPEEEKRLNHTPIKIGYARVSRSEQNPDLQLDALKKYGCEKIFCEKHTGAKWNRKGLLKCLSTVKKGDAIVVWRLDRLGRSMKEIVNTVESLQSQGIDFVSLREAIDTTTAVGKLTFHIFSALAQFERDLIIERTHAGLAAAKLRGRFPGRKRILSLDEEGIRGVRKLYESDLSIGAVARTLKVSRKTLDRYLDLAGIEKRPFGGLHGMD
jgi:DNA invertase Pin-like site-specific DNA recombinase